MQGYQLTFFTQQDRKHGYLPLGEWLVQEARKLGVGGATLIAASERGSGMGTSCTQPTSSSWLTSLSK